MRQIYQMAIHFFLFQARFTSLCGTASRGLVEFFEIFLGAPLRVRLSVPSPRPDPQSIGDRDCGLSTPILRALDIFIRD